MPYTYTKQLSNNDFKGCITQPQYDRPAISNEMGEEEKHSLMRKEAVIATAQQRINGFIKMKSRYKKNNDKDKEGNILFAAPNVGNNYCAIAFIKDGIIKVVRGESGGGGPNSHSERPAVRELLVNIGVKDQNILNNCHKLDYAPKVKELLISSGIEYIIFSERAPCPNRDGCDDYLKAVGFSDEQVYFAVKSSNPKFQNAEYKITDDDKEIMKNELQNKLSEFLNQSLDELYALSRQNKPSIDNTNIHQGNLEDVFECQKKSLAESLQTSKQQLEQLYSESPNDNILMEDELSKKHIMQESNLTKHQEPDVKQQQDITARPSINKLNEQNKTNLFKIDLPIKKQNPHKDRKKAQAVAERVSDKGTIPNPQLTGQQAYQASLNRMNSLSTPNKSTTVNPQLTGQQSYHASLNRMKPLSTPNKSTTVNPQLTGQQAYHASENRMNSLSTPNKSLRLKPEPKGEDTHKGVLDNKTSKKPDNFLTVAATANIHKNNRTEKINPQNEDNNQTFPSPS